MGNARSPSRARAGHTGGKSKKKQETKRAAPARGADELREIVHAEPQLDPRLPPRVRERILSRRAYLAARRGDVAEAEPLTALVRVRPPITAIRRIDDAELHRGVREEQPARHSVSLSTPLVQARIETTSTGLAGVLGAGALLVTGLVLRALVRGTGPTQ